jgi:hypothetical protein
VKSDVRSLITMSAVPFLHAGAGYGSRSVSNHSAMGLYYLIAIVSLRVAEVLLDSNVNVLKKKIPVGRDCICSSQFSASAYHVYTKVIVAGL